MLPDTPEAQSARTTATRRGWKWLGLLMLAIFGVGTAVVMWVCPGDVPPSPPPLPGDGRYDRRSPSPAGPAGWLTSRPAAAAGFVELAELPADLAMPRGAKRQSLVARRDAGAGRVKAEYLVRGSVPGVSVELRAALAAAGWRCVKADGGERRETMVMHKDADALSVRLHWRGDSVSIVAVIERAGPSGPE